MKTKIPMFAAAILIFAACSAGGHRLTRYVNPFLGTATLHDSTDLGFTPTWRTWGAEVFPGASLPNAMVQVSPVTQWRSGAGYQYEDTIIYAFSHTNKGHWNLNHVPIVAFAGDISPDDYASPYSHANEEAQPGYYRVYLERPGIDAEVTSTLRCAFHRYTFDGGGAAKILADLQRSNERVLDSAIEQDGEAAFRGFQQTNRETIYFHAEANRGIERIYRMDGEGDRSISIVEFGEGRGPLELRIGFSFVSAENAKSNLEAEMSGKSFAQVRKNASDTWEKLLSRIRVEGGSERQKGLFYSTLYRSFLWPALRSDVNGDFRGAVRVQDADGGWSEEPVTENKGFRYYTDPSFWDDYRNKLVLLAMISPEVTADVINSITYRGELSGFMPTFFHGDHASVFVAGTYLRGIRDGYDIQRAYHLLMNNATIEGARRTGGRLYLNEYIDRGWISEEHMDPPFVIHDERKAAVTKTQEYCYDDYATAILARELGYDRDCEMLMARTSNYKNLFNPANGFMQGRYEDGSWVEPFDPCFPYYAYMYREANGWQSIFYAPHDPEGMLALYPSPEAARAKLDSLFTVPWKGYEAHNMSVFIGQYCHGNQPDHGFPYMYYWLGQQPKSQKILDHILDNFYDMGPHGLAYSGMDDAGEMSAWYVFNAIGLYTFSPADPEYIVTVPIFDRVRFELPEGTFTIRKTGSGQKIASLTYGGEPLDGFYVSHSLLQQGRELVVNVE